MARAAFADDAPDHVRAAVGDLQQHAGRAFGVAAALLPIAQRPHADPHQLRELGLRHTEAFADDCHVGYAVLLGEVEGTGRFGLAAQDRSALSYALEQLVEQLVLQANSFAQAASAEKQRYE